ncbi:MAG: acyltransferase [Candidatus Omnitrophica bacterium]|nr:acyltransferase [Candidatus Omnitrophota bacterium]
MNFFNAVRTMYWVFYLRSRGAEVGKNFQVLGPLRILLRDGAVFKNLVIGDDVTFGGNTYIRIRREGKIEIGDRVKIGTETWLVGANDKKLSIGDDVVIGGYSIFNGGHGLSIGANCVIASFVYMNTSDHNFKKGELIRNQGYFGGPIHIGEDVWVGGHCFINKNVTVGKGAVLGAGAIVVKDIPEYKIAVGNPARVIKDRD